MFELEQIALHEGALDLLIGPRDEQLVVVIRLRKKKPRVVIPQTGIKRGLIPTRL